MRTIRHAGLFLAAVFFLTACSRPARWDRCVRALFFGVEPGTDPAVQLRRFGAVPALNRQGIRFFFTRHPLLKTPFQDGFVEMDTPALRSPGSILMDRYLLLQHLRFRFSTKEEAETAYNAFASLLKPLADSAAETVFPARGSRPVIERRFLFRQQRGTPIRFVSLAVSATYEGPRRGDTDEPSGYAVTLLPSQVRRGMVF